MIVLNDEMLVKCREYGLKTIHEINEFVRKYGIESNTEMEKVLNGEQAVYAITAIDEETNNEGDDE